MHIASLREFSALAQKGKGILTPILLMQNNMVSETQVICWYLLGTVHPE